MITKEDERLAQEIYNSDKSIFSFMVTSAGSIGQSKLSKNKEMLLTSWDDAMHG